MSSEVHTEVIDEKETKSEKFVRIVNKRMQNCVIAIGRMVNLGNKAVYEYTEDEAKEIQQVLDAECSKVYAAFGLDNVSVNDDLSKPSLPEYGGPEWKLVGDAKVEKDNFGNFIFAIRNGGSFRQDIKLPQKLGGKFVLFFGRGSSERINLNGLITGLPSLYGYLFDQKTKKGGKINTYLTGQKLLGKVSNSREWVLMYGVFEIPEGTVSARIFLNQAERKNLPQNGSAARFDNLGFYIFGSQMGPVRWLGSA